MISELVAAALIEAMNAQEALHRRWVRVTHQFAEAFGTALARHSDTRIDMLLRKLEDERIPRLKGPRGGEVDVSFDLQVSLSNAWTLSTYDALAAIPADRRTDRSRLLFAKTKLVRIPIAKASIADDWGLKGELALVPWGGSPSDAEPYVAGEYVPVMGVDPATGSISWQTIDGRSRAQITISRREISDELLALFD